MMTTENEAIAKRIVVEVNAADPLSRSLLNLQTALKAFDEAGRHILTAVHVFTLLSGSARGGTISGPEDSIENVATRVTSLTTLVDQLNAELNRFRMQWKIVGGHEGTTSDGG